MRKQLLKLNTYFKGFVLALRPHIFLYWLKKPFQTIANTLSLTKWIASQDKKDIFNDFYSPKRDHHKRYHLYQYISDKLNLKNESIDYLEFGVFSGNSFKWWINNCQNNNCKFYGFDTFEGLPENWGTYNKGEMSSNMPIINDLRGEFIKGLFQDTLPDFISNTHLKNGKRKIIHLDADLFSSTLFALTSLAPFMKKGDILLFDEFNVPNHEFLAFKMFCDSFYIKTKLLGAVNNYYQVAIIIE